MALQGNDEQKLDGLCNKTYKEQSVWFLNGFWKEMGEKEAVNIWNFTKMMESLDEKGPKETKLMK